MSEDKRDEYERRLVPASDAEIIELAKSIWADPKLQAAFQRTGLNGDLTDEEQGLLDETVDAYRQGALWDRDREHLLLAEGLVRRRVQGEFSDFDDPAIPPFLDDRRVERIGRGHRPKNATIDEVLGLAHALREDPVIWDIFQRAHAEGIEFLSDKTSEEWENAVNWFTWRYKVKHSLMNRGSITYAVGHVRGIAAGLYDSVDSPEFRKNFEKYLKS